ncbi:MFS transporter [Roseiflexus sp.]|uniref:MFS transporter n=1 Tax=Roseiflexus sp. TaxID=2562120 RepID=UPI00398B80B1
MTGIAEPKSATFGRVELHPGVSRLNMSTFYFSAFISICLLSFVNLIQPYLLTEILKVPLSEQGSVTGAILFWHEMVIIFTIGLAGSLSDTVGRRLIFAASFLIVGIGYGLMIQAGSAWQLIIFRMLFAAGAAGVTSMLSTVLADYVKDRDRGKANGVQGVMNGIGAMTAVFVLLNMPEWFKQSGMDSVAAGFATYYTAAGLSAIAALLLWLGLKEAGVRERAQPKRFIELITGGVRAARDPGVLLGYGAAFVSRGDLAIIGTFLALWINKHGVESGYNAAEALARASIIIGISQLAAFLGAPLFGILADRVNRVTALAVTNVISGLGYISLFLIDDPFGGAMFAAVAVAGVGNIGTLISTQVLIQQQTPADIRGSVIGFFGLCGAVGILAASKLGGWLFDVWTESGPFVVFGLLSFVLAAWALVVRNDIRPVRE